MSAGNGSTREVDEVSQLLEGRLNKWRARQPKMTDSGRHMDIRFSYHQSLREHVVSESGGDGQPFGDMSGPSRFDDEDDYYQNSHPERPMESIDMGDHDDLPSSAAATATYADAGTPEVLASSARLREVNGLSVRVPTRSVASCQGKGQGETEEMAKCPHSDDDLSFGDGRGEAEKRRGSGERRSNRAGQSTRDGRDGSADSSRLRNSQQGPTLDDEGGSSERNGRSRPSQSPREKSRTHDSSACLGAAQDRDANEVTDLSKPRRGSCLRPISGSDSVHEKGTCSKERTTQRSDRDGRKRGSRHVSFREDQKVDQAEARSERLINKTQTTIQDPPRCDERCVTDDIGFSRFDDESISQKEGSGVHVCTDTYDVPMEGGRICDSTLGSQERVSTGQMSSNELLTGDDPNDCSHRPRRRGTPWEILLDDPQDLDGAASQRSTRNSTSLCGARTSESEASHGNLGGSGANTYSEPVSTTFNEQLAIGTMDAPSDSEKTTVVESSSEEMCETLPVDEKNSEQPLPTLLGARTQIPANSKLGSTRSARTAEDQRESSQKTQVSEHGQPLVEADPLSAQQLHRDSLAVLKKSSVAARRSQGEEVGERRADTAFRKSCTGAPASARMSQRRSHGESLLKHGGKHSAYGREVSHRHDGELKEEHGIARDKQQCLNRHRNTDSLESAATATEQHADIGGIRSPSGELCSSFRSAGVNGRSSRCRNAGRVAQHERGEEPEPVSAGSVRRSKSSGVTGRCNGQVSQSARTSQIACSQETRQISELRERRGDDAALREEPPQHGSFAAQKTAVAAGRSLSAEVGSSECRASVSPPGRRQTLSTSAHVSHRRSHGGKQINSNTSDLGRCEVSQGIDRRVDGDAPEHEDDVDRALGSRGPFTSARVTQPKGAGTARASCHEDSEEASGEEQELDLRQHSDIDDALSGKTSCAAELLRDTSRAVQAEGTISTPADDYVSTTRASTKVVGGDRGLEEQARVASDGSSYQTIVVSGSKSEDSEVGDSSSEETTVILSCLEEETRNGLPGILRFNVSRTPICREAASSHRVVSGQTRTEQELVTGEPPQCGSFAGPNRSMVAERRSQSSDSREERRFAASEDSRGSQLLSRGDGRIKACGKRTAAAAEQHADVGSIPSPGGELRSSEHQSSGNGRGSCNYYAVSAGQAEHEEVEPAAVEMSLRSKSSSVPKECNVRTSQSLGRGTLENSSRLPSRSPRASGGSSAHARASHRHSHVDGNSHVDAAEASSHDAVRISGGSDVRRRGSAQQHSGRTSAGAELPCDMVPSKESACIATTRSTLLEFPSECVALKKTDSAKRIDPERSEGGTGASAGSGSTSVGNGTSSEESSGSVGNDLGSPGKSSSNRSCCLASAAADANCYEERKTASDDRPHQSKRLVSNARCSGRLLAHESQGEGQRPVGAVHGIDQDSSSDTVVQSDSEATLLASNTDEETCNAPSVPQTLRSHLRSSTRAPLRSSGKQAKSLSVQKVSALHESCSISTGACQKEDGAASAHGHRVAEELQLASDPAQRSGISTPKKSAHVPRSSLTLARNDGRSLSTLSQGQDQEELVRRFLETEPAADVNPPSGDGCWESRYRRAACRYGRRGDAEFVGLDVEPQLDDARGFVFEGLAELDGPERSRAQVQLQQADIAVAAMLGATQDAEVARAASLQLPSLLSKLCKEFAVHALAAMEAPIGETLLAIDGVPASLAMLIRIVELLDVLVGPDGGDICNGSSGCTSVTASAGAGPTDAAVRALSDAAGLGGILPLCVQILRGEVAVPSTTFGSELSLHAVIAARLLVNWLPPLGVPRPRGQVHAFGGHEALVNSGLRLLHSVRDKDAPGGGGGSCRGRASVSSTTDFAHLAMILDTLQICTGSEEFAADIAIGRECSVGRRRGARDMVGNRTSRTDPAVTLVELAIDTLEHAAILPFSPTVSGWSGGGAASVAIDAAAAAALSLIATVAGLPLCAALGDEPARRIAAALSHILSARPLTLRLAVALRGLVCKSSPVGRGGWLGARTGHTEGFFRELRRVMAAEGIAAGCVRAVRHHLDVARSAHGGTEDESHDGSSSGVSVLMGQGIQATAAGAAAHVALFGTLYGHIEEVVRALDISGGRGGSGKACAELERLRSEDPTAGQMRQASSVEGADGSERAQPPHARRRSSLDDALRSLRRSIRRTCIAPYLRY